MFSLISYLVFLPGINFAVQELDLFPCDIFSSIGLVGFVEIPAYIGKW